MPTPQNLPVAVATGMKLSTLDEAKELSRCLAISQMMPRDIHGKPNDVLAIVLYGQELGLGPMQSLQGIYVVKGRPQISGTLWVALARRAGHRVRIFDSTDKACSVEIIRNDDPRPHVETYTFEDAERAKLVTLKDGKPYSRSQSGAPQPWELYTKTMLRNRAISAAGKAQCPEVAFGFGIEGDNDYIEDEPVRIAPPEHHGQVMDAELVDDPVAVSEALDKLKAELGAADAVNE